jgi:hypothetical protein
MNLNSIALFLTATSIVATATPASAKVDVTAKPWQVASLKGIGQIKYGVVYDPTNALAKSVALILSASKVPMKSVIVKDDQNVPLATAEARMKIYSDARDKDQLWVGLSVEQKSKLDRTPSVTYDAETYKIGKLCKRADEANAIKELCTTFINDLNGEDKKTR